MDGRWRRFANNSEILLTWWLSRNARPFFDWPFKEVLADMPDCPRCNRELEETALHAFYYCERVRAFWSHVGEWTAPIDLKQLVLLDVGYIVDNVLPAWKGEKRAIARMVI